MIYNKNTPHLSPQELLSETISWLRFPLIIGVVLIHCRVKEMVFGGVNILPPLSEVPIYAYFSQWLSAIISSVAVPMFFFFSGFLFFYKVKEFDKSIYLTKLKKRARTLLLPYIIWNFLVIAFTLVSQLALPSMFSGRNMPVTQWGVIEWVSAFWCAQSQESLAFPICYQFWFIRDLMVTLLLTPIIYTLIKRFHFVLPLLLGLIWLFGYGSGIYAIGFVAPRCSSFPWALISASMASIMSRRFYLLPNPFL